MTMWFDATRGEKNIYIFFFTFLKLFGLCKKPQQEKSILKYSVNVAELQTATCNVVSGPTFLSGHRLKGEEKKCQSSDAKMCLGKQSRHGILCAERLTVQP